MPGRRAGAFGSGDKPFPAGSGTVPGQQPYQEGSGLHGNHQVRGTRSISSFYETYFHGQYDLKEISIYEVAINISTKLQIWPFLQMGC